LKKSTESLTRYNYQQLLEVVGKSPNPLSAYQIAKQMGNSDNKYVYEMISKHLYPDLEDPYITITFRTDNIPGIKAEEINLATVLNGVFELNFPLAKTGKLFVQKGMQFRYVDHSQLEFSRNIVNDTITVSCGSISSVKIEPWGGKYGNARFAKVTIKRKKLQQQLQQQQPDEGSSSNDTVEEGPYNFVCRSDGRRLFIYFHKYRIEDFTRPVMYLHKTIDPKVEFEIQDRSIEYERRRRQELPKEETACEPPPASTMPSSRDYRYSLDIRGLILLILGKIGLENERYGGRAQNLRILQVLQNLSVNYVDRFPFLLYFNGFRSEYKLLEDAHKVRQNFIASLIKEIAEELRFQVHLPAGENYLKYWLIRRFSGGITYYFATSIKMGLIPPDKDLKYLSFDTLKSYQLENLEAMAEILREEHTETQGNYDLLLYNNFQLPIYY
jgi:hypothetical protein